MRSVVLFIASLFVTTSVAARTHWLPAALHQTAPHAIDLSGGTTMNSVRAVEDADMPLTNRYQPDEKWSDSILPHLGVEPSNAAFDGHSRKRHHMVTYGLEGLHPFGGNISGSLGTRGAAIHITWPSGQ